MSRQFRYRMAALGLSGLIFGAPLLTNGTASAEQLEGNDRQVSFGGGGVLGLSCGSKPSVESMTVPAGSVVRVLNQTGHDAQLKLAGSPKGTIPADGAAEVVFRRGATSVLLTPDCSLGEDALPVLITATPSADEGRPDPAPAPTSGNSASVMMSKPAGPGSQAHSRNSVGSALPDSAATGTRPARTSPNSSRPGVRRPSESRPATAVQDAAIAAQAMPRGDVAARLKAKTMRGTGGIGAPAFAGMPPGDRKTILPGTATAPPAPVRQTAVSPTMAGAGGVETAGPGSFAAAEPVAAVGRIDEGHPLGLLGLTALVLVLGVATAAIRAIVSQRASRTNLA
ncbi:hypothetical protein [Actinoplanes sp. NPDC049802]|uniref:hypothetical protein n=1 Tax=Actinoplanes sp. NPDC049802 TaxID=3154742 RepID=UPI0033F73165